jgi:putative two-component system response regulator
MTSRLEAVSSKLKARPSSELGSSWLGLADFHHRLLEDVAEPPSVVLIAERETDRRMLAALLRRENCRILEARCSDAGLALLQNSRPDLVIIDRDMSVGDGLDCCRAIKNTRGADLIPILLVTARSTVADEVEGIQAGAAEYLSKPLHPEIFRARIRSLIRHKVAIDRLEESEAILFALAKAVEKRDPSTAGHCQRLALFSAVFGMRMGLSQAHLMALHRGGYLHDIGKIAVPDAILFKPGRLTPEEWVLMKSHCVRGEEICAPLRSLKDVLPIIRSHHERWDGSGYPDGLSGERIPLLARVLQLADAYDALVSERPYKAAYSREQALDILAQEAHFGWRDPVLTGFFLKMSFKDMDAEVREIAATEDSEGFESSILNLQRHHTAVA